MSAPLFISTDVRTLRLDSQQILLNRAVLSVNQDQLGRLGLDIQQVSRSSNYVKPIHHIADDDSNAYVLMQFSILSSYTVRFVQIVSKLRPFAA